MIPYGRQHITEADIEAVVKALRSDFLTQGPVVPVFESAITDYCGAKHAIAVNSGTSALHIACLALGLGPGDWLWTSPNTFVASANCALYCGAKVDFVDIDPKTYNMCVDDLAVRLEKAKQRDRLPKIVIPVHFAGQSCEMQKIRALSKKYGFYIIEDASHAIGGRYQGCAVGDCRYSDITVFSFHPVKIITTGEGGMAVTNDPDLAKKMELLRSHGITRDRGSMTGDPDGSWYYQQICLGFNYRMTDIQAALGYSQIDRLEDYISKRRGLAKRYDRLLADLPLTLPFEHPDSHSAFHLYVIRREHGSPTVREQLFETLRAAGIGVNVHYIPVHTQPYYRERGFGKGAFPQAERYYEEAISLPMYPALEEGQQDRVIGVLKQALQS